MSVAAAAIGQPKGAAQTLFRAAYSVLRPMGLDVRALRTKDRRIVGVQLRRAGAVAKSEIGEIVRCEVGGEPIAFFVQHSTDEIQSQHRRGLFYEPEELAIIARHFNGGVFVDAGANVGNHSLYALKFLAAERVIAFEPNPDAYQILLVNMALNRVAERVTLHSVGLSDRRGRATFETPEDNLGGTRLDTSSGEGTFEIVTGDSALGGTRVDFIKIDTEGMELSVLAGFEETISRWRPPIFVEVEDRHRPGLDQWTESHGYRIEDRFSRYPMLDNLLLTPGVKA